MRACVCGHSERGSALSEGLWSLVTRGARRVRGIIVGVWGVQVGMVVFEVWRGGAEEVVDSGER